MLLRVGRCSTHQRYANQFNNPSAVAAPREPHRDAGEACILMIDAGLAVLCGVTTTQLDEQFKRNADRFPDDFMFKLTPEEQAGVRR